MAAGCGTGNDEGFLSILPGIFVTLNVLVCALSICMHACMEYRIAAAHVVARCMHVHPFIMIIMIHVSFVSCIAREIPPET